MSNAEYHEMELKRSYPTGAQEWACTECSRRFVLQGSPAFNIIDLEIGDQHVSHVGATGEARIGMSRIGKGREQIVSDELRAALEEALEDLDFDE